MLISADARELTVVTWNLGWHQTQAEAKEWISQCDQPFAFNATSQQWEPSARGETKIGWQLKWGRDAKIKWDIAKYPPCDVYQANFKIVPVTEAAYRKRAQQIQNFIRKELGDAEILAFQETSGEPAVREILPGNGAGYRFCSFTTFKIQRLVIAWKSSLGDAVDCVVNDALSLPQVTPKDQVRPGLSATLQIDGRPLRILTVHLKSSCVSPLEERGRLSGNNEACQLLQKQIVPLEQWIEARSAEGAIVMMGDFNRNLHHEKNRIPQNQARTNGSDPSSPLPNGVFVNSLFAEINDSVPGHSNLALLDTECPVEPVAKEICARSKNEFFNQQALRPLTRANSLGCRNPVGLDHIFLSPSLVSGSAVKVSIGPFGGTRPATDKNPDPLLAISDHCPLKATIKF